jgi:hypothetical protein
MSDSDSFSRILARLRLHGVDGDEGSAVDRLRDASIAIPGWR